MCVDQSSLPYQGDQNWNRRLYLTMALRRQLTCMERMIFGLLSQSGYMLPNRRLMNITIALVRYALPRSETYLTNLDQFSTGIERMHLDPEFGTGNIHSTAMLIILNTIWLIWYRSIWGEMQPEWKCTSSLVHWYTNTELAKECLRGASSL